MLKRHCEVKWRATGPFLISMETKDSPLVPKYPIALRLGR